MKNQMKIFVRLGVMGIVVFVLSLASCPISAQVSGGLAGISGIVRDTTGAVVPGAQVVVSNSLKGVHLTLDTSDGGIFNAPSLAPATGYEVTVDKQGFSQYVVKDILLAVGQNLNLEVSLSIAGASERVEVVGTAPVVDTTKTSVSQVIGSQQILDLPINGRRVDSFVLLTPGVTNDGNYGLLTFRGVANGNTFLLDGNDSTEQFYVENNGRTRITSQISADAVQEFQVVSADYSAEYGRASGGVVNTVTRSGNNDFHGTLYTFYRNQDMMARDPYIPDNVSVDQWRLQSGASLGGPIVKDKLFFFINGDFTRNDWPLYDSLTSKTSVVNSSGPTPVFVGCGTGTTPATTAQCDAINALLPAYVGLIPRTVDQDLAFGRLDYNLSDRNKFSFSFNYMHFKSPNGLQQTLATSTTGAGVSSNGDDYGRVRNGKVAWTSIVNPNLVNEFRYGLNTDLEGDNPSSSLINALGLLDVCVGSTSSSCSSGLTLGPINYLPRVEPNETRNEFGDDLSWTKGKHIFKFGVDIATTSDFSIYMANLNGEYVYANANSFALDYPESTGAKNYSKFYQSFGNPAVTTRINDYDFYAEDQWRATDKLTLNLGLRYEYEHLPDPSVCNPSYPLTCHINSPAGDIMPRIGFAYRLTDKTVLRGGYGIYYARMAGATLQDLFTGNAVVTTPISLTTTSQVTSYGPVFPNILTSIPTSGTPAASSVNIQFAAPNLLTPYTEQASFGVERELAHDLTMTVSYLWSRGVHLYSVQDLNMPTATTPYTYTIENSSGAVVGTYTTPVLVGTRPNSNIGSLFEDGNAITSFYNALSVQVQKRFSHGFMADLSFTWSHEIDDGQGYGQATSNMYLSNNYSWLANGNFQADRGNGEEDQPLRAVLSWIWAPTFTHRSGAFYTYLVNNWQISSITTIDGARPYGSATINTSGTAPVSGMFSSFTLNGQDLSSRVPFWPVNSVWQPALYRDDMRIMKIIPITERFKASIGLEIFNISNSWSPTTMSTGAAFNETGGIITPNVPSTGPAYGVGSGDGWPIDGTEARRLQINARLTF